MNSGIDDVLRIIDANANRAREGIRTGEDYIRFHVGDQRKSSLLKEFRGRITHIIRTQMPQDPVLGRNVVSDPLNADSGVEAARAQEKENAKDIARRGMKRAQEAVRVIEEYLRGISQDGSAELSKIRYCLYDVEQWLAMASDAIKVLTTSQVYVLITESLCRRSLNETAELVLKGGARVLQLREKEKTDRELVAEVRGLRLLCDKYDAVLICNDRLDVSLAGGAYGVHLGQNELTAPEARMICGRKLIVGRSTHSLAQARSAVEVEEADYIAIGSIFETSTKRERILAGLALAKDVSALKLPLPVFAIGGINLENVRELKAAGVDKVAVSSAIVSAEDPETATRNFISVMKN